MSAATALRSPIELPEGHWIDDDGYQIDADGEVIAFVGKPAAIVGPFVIDDRDKAEWVLSKLADAESQAQAIERRRVILIANLTRQIRHAQVRIDSIHRRFDSDLETFARGQLAGQKSKTLQLDHGRISFRASKGTTTIRDMDKAVAWMRENGYGDDVKVVATVTATALAKRIEDEREDLEYEEESTVLDDEVAPFVERTGPRESVTITTDLRS